jgi:4-oxalocrotonate tautomerase
LPLVEVSIWAGICNKDKKKLVEGITNAISEIGIPREAITIIIHEIPKSNWASGGQLHSARFTNVFRKGDENVP